MRLLTMATDNPLGFDYLCETLDEMFYSADAVQRGEWQAQKTEDKATRELNHVVLELPIPQTIDSLIDMVQPNLPWAEKHFLERVSGQPLNPPPSAAEWPFAQGGHRDHTKAGTFSHTYPERFAPRWAGDGEQDNARRGIRFEYGDIDTLCTVMARNPRSRQLYLPVWFPEDLEAARQGARVPCTIGYHFLYTRDGVDCTYHIRSCDYMRHFRDDVYMAMRLTQWVADEVYQRQEQGGLLLVPGKLYMHISNFHTFVGDDPVLLSRVKDRIPSVTVHGGE